MKRILLFSLIVFVFYGCGNDKAYNPYSIGRDTGWFPLQLGKRIININGFTDALIQEIAENEKVPMTIVDTDWLQLFSGLEEKNYGGAFTSIFPTVESLSKYSFSKPFIWLGPVLVVPAESDVTSIEKLDGKIVGVNQFDESVLIVQKHPSIVIRLYQNVPTALEELSQGALDGLLVANLEAQALIPHLYPDQLKIVTPPLNDKALRVITLKNENRQLIKHFNKGLETLRQSGHYDQLLEQFGLHIQRSSVHG